MGHRPSAWVPWLALIAAPMVACASEDPPTDLYELSGYVTEALADAPIEGARVTFVSDTLYTTSATTDEDGFYEMTVETDTPFGQVRAEKDGFIRNEATVYFDSGSRRVDLAIRRAAAEE